MAGHVMFANALPAGRLRVRWRTLPAIDHLPVTVAVTYPDGREAALPGVCVAWSRDRRLAMVNVLVGTERHPAVFRVEDVNRRDPEPTQE